MQSNSSASALLSAPPPDPVLQPLASLSQEQGLDELSNRLSELQIWMADDLEELDRALAKIQGSAQDAAGTLAKRAAGHLLSRPGKRIRPLCVMLGARMGNRGLDPAVRDLAVSCELVHAATLLHDDVIDEGAERRGIPASRTVFGNSASILAGDHLLITALTLVEGAGPRSLLMELLEVIAQMVAAEALQLERRGSFDPSQEASMKIIRGKSASLFRWGLRAGGRISGLNEDHIDLLGNAGMSLGIAFQLIDDVLDLEGEHAALGKHAWADLREGKLTWPLIIAAEREPELYGMLKTIASSATNTPVPDKITREALARIQNSGALESTRDFAAQHGNDARHALRQLPLGQARRAIELVVDSALKRVS